MQSRDPVHHPSIPSLALTGIGKKFHHRRSWFQPERQEEDEDEDQEAEEETSSAAAPDPTSHWVLKDISFTVARGERVAIVGPNGSGKSTLLRIVGGLCLPTEGMVWGKGCVIPLNSILKPFQARASGLSNLRVMCQILRIERKLLDERLREIVAFAELKGRMHDPVSSYSKAMYERLAAAAVLHLEPDILLIDDGFSAGDQGFREKLEAKLLSVIEAGAVLLYAGHKLSALEVWCDRTIWLEGGRMRDDGPAKSVIGSYEKSSRISTPVKRCA
jgi:ABC-type polysaccharide/polyol phosphate transport system ATPase subunit